MYNSTQAQPQVPPISSPWSKVKKKPRPNGGDSNLDDEAGFNPSELSEGGPDLYLDEGVNLSPAIVQQLQHPQHHLQQQQQHHQQQQQHHQPITTTPIMRRDRSLSPTATHPPVSSVLTNVSRSDLQTPRSAPASPQKMRPNNPTTTATSYQTQYGGNGYVHHPHPQIRRFVVMQRHILLSSVVIFLNLILNIHFFYSCFTGRPVEVTFPTLFSRHARHTAASSTPPSVRVRPLLLLT